MHKTPPDRTLKRFELRSSLSALAVTFSAVCGGVLLLLLLTTGCDSASEQTNAQQDGAALTEPSGVADSANGRDADVDRKLLARRAMRAGDLATAEMMLRQQLLLSPSDAESLELAGDVAAAQSKPSEAVSLYQAAIDTDSEVTPMLYDKLVQQWMVIGCPFSGFDVLVQAVERFPTYVQFRYDLVGIGTIIGMADVSAESLRWLFQRNQSDSEGLTVLASPYRVEPDPSICEKALQRCSQDLRPRYALALLDARHGDWQTVADSLEAVNKRHPDFVPAQALRGRALAELNRAEELEQWRQQVPPEIDQSPTYWLAAGRWAEQQQEMEQAARAYAEAVRLEQACNGESLNLLLASLHAIGRTQEANLVGERAVALGNMHDAIDTLFERVEKSQIAAFRVADAMMELGRIWEAEGWARYALSMPEDHVADPREAYMAIRSKLSVDTPWQLPEENVGSQIDLNDLPKIAWTSRSRDSADTFADSLSSTIRFEDQAEPRGLSHICEFDKETTPEGMWIYQSLGGGAAVIDFNLDGWPDIVAGMLDGQPLKDDSSVNRLFQNLNGQFHDITDHTGLADHGFSQGFAVGDFNDDGFPDLFDGNIGRNRLYQNNGDGTFRDVTEQVGLEGLRWTSSVAIADLNSDGFADLFEVNYCGGTEPYTKKCGISSGATVCPPLHFEAEPDRIWLGSAEGRFTDATDRLLNPSNPGRGIGLIVGRLTEREGMDIFVANDMTANHLWSSVVKPDRSYGLEELAGLRGLAFDRFSKSQASMGIAAGDPDNDGDVDLFVTHFTKDNNTYYEQIGPGMWADRSTQTGLAAPSMEMLGFGAQFADFDNSGSLELMVTNGHINDLREQGLAFRMPSQLFAREPNGRWSEMPRDELGEFFQQQHLGRVLAVLDANRDHLTDVIITRMFDPVSLLINQTESAGNSLQLILVATNSQRDAIGAKMTASIAGKPQTAQLFGGDGFMTTNQRRITLTLGKRLTADQVEIHWPSGTRESFESLAANHEYLLVEGSGEAFQLAP